jgi:YD repeat-containing protein
MHNKFYQQCLPNLKMVHACTTFKLNKKSKNIFMKQLLLSFFLFLIIQNTNAQSSTSSINAQFIPNVFLPTPQQASLAKVSEIPVDITTGRMDFKIPLYEIKEKGLSLPISLSYNYSGLLLEESAGWAGTGWVFNIGGSIIHSVNGQDDDYHQGSKNLVEAYLLHTPPFDGNRTEQAYITQEGSFLDLLATGQHDGLPDKYIVNIGDINCSFYLNKDDNPIFLKNEPYKVSFTGTRGFVLTDDRGIQYTFDKKITSNYHAPKNMDLGALDEYDYTSSYLITEIKFPDSTNKISFEYTDTNIYYQDVLVNQSLVLAYYPPFGGGAFSTINRNPTIISTFNSYLKKITTAQETIEVSYNNSPTGLAVINNLKIKEKNNVVKNYDLNYSNWFDRRINLLSVSCNGQMMNEMEYDMSKPYPIPDRGDPQYEPYLKKDLWGYYNAKYNPPTNVSYTPTNNDPKALMVNNSPYNNPTVKPDYESTKIGSLTKITYATKGYSLIDYEPNKVYMTRDGYNLPYDPDTVIPGGGESATSPFLITSIDDQVVMIYAKCQAVISYYLSFNSSISPYDLDSGGTVKFYKDGESSTPIFNKGQTWLNEAQEWKPAMSYFRGSQMLDLEPGTYHLQSTSTKGTMASISLVTTTLPEKFDQTVGGMRIKQIKNCDFNGKCITNSYTYDDKNYTSGVALANLQFSAGSYFLSNMCTNNSNTSYNYHNYSSIYPLSPYRGSPVLYRVVTKSIKDDNGNANGKEVFYSTIDNSLNSNNPERSMLINGSLEKKTISNQSNQKLEETVNAYEYSIDSDVFKKVYGIKASLKKDTFTMTGNDGCFRPPHTYDSFSTTVLSHTNGNYKIKTETVSQYYKNDSLVTKTTYNYNLATGVTTGKSQTTSKTGETLETKYYYPQDAGISQKPLMSDLVQANIIGTPVNTETYRAGTKLSEQLTVYDKSASTSNLLLPKTVYAAKFPNSLPSIFGDKNVEKKITYDRYDDRGNILQYTIEGSSPIAIIWGYNKTLPIAKIENATYDQIMSYVTNLQSLSDVDDDNCMSANCKEQILRNSLNALRASFSQGMITTYTYNPLVGVTSVTDPKGTSSYYEYDSLGRLKFVKDKDLNILQKYCYNYKGQQTDCSDNTSTSVFSYKSNAVSGSFTKNNCAAGGTGSSVSFSLAAGAVVSTLSQEDADSKALAKLNTDGQVNANTNGYCTFYSTALSGTFTKNNCGSAGIGSSVPFSQAAGVGTSNVSQAEANANGLAIFNSNGLANANANGSCTYYNLAKSVVFTRNNCAAGGSPASVAYNVLAGKYSSNTSQAAADAQAQDEVNNNGQAFANNDANAKCTFYNIAKSGVFTRNNCAAGGTPATITYTVPAGKYNSYVSQAAVDALAQNDVSNNGQTFANNDANAKCTFANVAKSVSVTRNNCDAGGVPGSVIYTVPAAKYWSTNSQAAADSQADDEINANKQAFANANAKCTFSNPLLSKTANKNNCGTGKYGSTSTYTIPAGMYTSLVSQADANANAQNDLTSNYQNYANTNGTCSTETYGISVVDAESELSNFLVGTTCTSANHPARTISAIIEYKNSANKSSILLKDFVLPANKTSATIGVQLVYRGTPVILSFTVN